MEVEALKIEMQKITEQLTMSQNQERAAKEKAEHLEKDLRRAEHQLNNQGTEF